MVPMREGDGGLLACQQTAELILSVERVRGVLSNDNSFRRVHAIFTGRKLAVLRNTWGVASSKAGGDKVRKNYEPRHPRAPRAMR